MKRLAILIFKLYVISELYFGDSYSQESNPTKAIKWADLEQAAREEREEKRRRKAAQKAEAELEQEGLLQKQNYISGKNYPSPSALSLLTYLEPPGRSASLNSASAYEIPATLQESSSDSSEKKDEEQVQLDDDDYDGYVGPEKEDEDTTPVLIAAGVTMLFLNAFFAVIFSNFNYFRCSYHV